MLVFSKRFLLTALYRVSVSIRPLPCKKKHLDLRLQCSRDLVHVGVVGSHDERGRKSAVVDTAG